MYHRQMVTGQPVTTTRHLLTKDPVNPTQSYLYQKPRLFQCYTTSPTKNAEDTLLLEMDGLLAAGQMHIYNEDY